MNATTRTELESILAQDRAELARLDAECKAWEAKIEELERPFRAVRHAWSEVYNRIATLEKIIKRMEQAP